MDLTCQNCGETHQRRSKTGPIPAFCLTCAKARERKRISGWNKRNGGVGRKATADYRVYREALIFTAKSVPCADCRVSYPPVVMDFDHVRGEKLKNVSRMRSVALDKLVAEIAKCDVVCSNCHRLRTHARLGAA